MVKVSEMVTVSRPFTAYTRDEVHNDIKVNFLDKGWDLFATHLAGFTGPELAMIYVLVKYEDTDVGSSSQDVAVARKRGRPAKVLAESELVAEG